MSGYTANAIVDQGLLETGAPFLSKPFTPASLALAIRSVLDGVPARETPKRSRPLKPATRDRVPAPIKVV